MSKKSAKRTALKRLEEIRKNVKSIRVTLKRTKATDKHSVDMFCNNILGPVGVLKNEVENL